MLVKIVNHWMLVRGSQLLCRQLVCILGSFANCRGRSESLGGKIDQFISDLIGSLDHDTTLLAFKSVANGELLIPPITVH
jgi:hypothetical protein